MIGNTFESYADLESHVDGNTSVLEGKYFVNNDETRNNVPSEYYVNTNKVVSLVNAQIIYNGDLF
jgi:hypothetical protein